jgi:hypothetical protein
MCHDETVFLQPRICTKIAKLDSLQTEAYDEPSYDSVVTLHHTDRENRAMASVFSSHAASFPYSSDRNDQLTQPSALITVSTLLAVVSKSGADRTDPQHTSLLHGTTANDADRSTK